ncbi:RnfABCDGE type electron transport complex subunit B [Kineothrix sp. MB12-C1]|uniref:RnfABCDGE type electron transport complex subunit B n=1 Tax=Kineothrix sp. MB12-C1 TaxID=3070215 RepID=UPI0027D2FA19|nr:RnfABCDGE type electron transport complex subunit B [Kineothrix sp. MB12-C1]WMC92423.1 RnfABCDGE type electron transport complex subunit B [Kineothrix sp. MB12-C1]
MSITGVVIAVAMIGAIGLFVGVFLGVAAIKFHVEVDEREEAVLAALPGNNCGGCGFPGCSGLAAAIVKGEAAVNACPVGGEAVGKAVAQIMGVEAEAATRMVAFVECQGDCDKTTRDYEYSGVEDCRMMAYVPGGGPKTCNYGCHGYGNCVRVCPFDAIHVVNGVAVVDRDACKACGKCVEECPKELIKMIPYDAMYVVACNSKDKGPVTTKACSVGCIGCQLCKKNCPSEAVDVVEFNATIDYEKCIECGVCMEKCPKKTILKRA